MRALKGFTLIEIMIVLVILVVVGIVFFSMVGGVGNSNISYGWGGFVETRCINGYQFTITNGHARQVYDQFGHGITCHAH